MTATQAPTPGPLSAEDWASLADLHTLKGWLHGVSLTPDWNDVVADGGVTVAMVVQQEAGQMASRVGRVIDNFRLAPTAPVEASGSEREHGPKCWGKTSISDEMMYCYCGSTDSPSGETRAALGGQKGDSETLRVLLDNLVIAQTLSKDIRQKATDEACSYLYDRRTTPARAEAQDEGAAGSDAVSHHAKTDADPVVSMLRDVAERLDRPEPDLLGARVGVQAVRLAVSSRLLARPSPPRGADEDRVRIAAEALIKAEDEARQRLREVWTPLPSTPEVDALRQALAALKSEGK